MQQCKFTDKNIKCSSVATKNEFCKKHHEVMTERTMTGTGLGGIMAGALGFGPLGIIIGAAGLGLLAYNSKKAKDERKNGY
jgi:hypothetical protein